MYQPAPKVRGHATLVHLVYIEGEMLAVTQNIMLPNMGLK